MAAALTLEAHGRLIRLLAKIGGLHCQGLGALAASLRRSGCTSSRLLRRLSQLDAAAGVLRHITVISVAELEADLKMELVKLGAADRVTEMDRTGLEDPQAVNQMATQQVVQQPDALPDLPQDAQIGVSSDTEQVLQQRAALKMAARFAQVDPPRVPLGQAVPFRLGGRDPDPPFGEGAKRVRFHPSEVDLRQEDPPLPQVEPPHDHQEVPLDDPFGMARIIQMVNALVALPPAEFRVRMDRIRQAAGEVEGSGLSV